MITDDDKWVTYENIVKKKDTVNPDNLHPPSLNYNNDNARPHDLESKDGNFEE